MDSMNAYIYILKIINPLMERVKDFSAFLIA